MTNYFKIIFSLLLALSVITSCKSKHQDKTLIPSAACIQLNNEGTDSLMNYPLNGEQGLNKAIDLYKQAIACDSTYVLANINLSNAYDHKNNSHEEMVVYNKILALTNNDPEFLFQKGMLFEKMNHIDSAKQTYALTKAGYEKRLVGQPDNIGAIEGLIRLKAVTDGKDEAIAELDNQIKIHPKLAAKLTEQYDFYKYFDRHAFVYRLPVELPAGK